MNEPAYSSLPTYREAEDINLGAFFRSIKSTLAFIARRWYVLLLFVGMTSAIALLYAWWYGTRYKANASFAVEGQTAATSLLSSALSLANALGIQTVQGKNNTYTNNFFAELVKSRKVIKEALLETAPVQGKNDLLANHYVRVHRLHTGGLLSRGWNSDSRLRNFQFTAKPLVQLTALEDSLLEIVYQRLVDRNLDVVYDQASPFNTATFTSKNQDLSKYALHAILMKASNYYMDNVYDLNKQNMRVAEMRVDSIGRELRKLEYKLADLRDQANRVVRQKGLLPISETQREVALLTTQYEAAVNNLELAKVTVLTMAPILQVIDNPLYSLEVSYVRRPMALIVATIVGLFLGTIYLIILRSVKLSDERMKQPMQQGGVAT